MRRATSAKRMKVNVRDKKTDELFGVARSSVFFRDNQTLCTMLRHSKCTNMATVHPNNSDRETE